MSVHAYHDGLPGYDPRQIWHDGCGECESRGARLAIGQLDASNFARAWERAAEWNMRGGNLAISEAEAPLLNALWAVQCQLERHGFEPGYLPSAVSS